MFPIEPPLSQYISISAQHRINSDLQTAIGDIRQPWIDLGNTLGLSAFTTKALFSLGMMQRYILSANVVLKDMRHHGFLSAYGMLSSGIELLGRCVAEEEAVRQHPRLFSGKRLQAGFEYIRRPRLRSGVIVETNHYPEADGGYSIEDLKNLRNLVAHGASIAEVSAIKGDIELLHQLRKAFYGVPIGDHEPHEGDGPIRGALDNYYEALASGNPILCERLASAAISPAPLQLQRGAWPFDTQLVNEIKQHIEENLRLSYFPISGKHRASDDYFQLYA